MTKVWASFTSPNTRDESAGYALISVQLLTEQEAFAKPAGEAQEEPNDDPRLVKPTEGRGYGDSLAGMGFKLPSISLPSFDYFRNIFYTIIAGIVLAVIGFLMFYFKN